ncbi:DNA-directed RNA polymerase subunit B [Vulcanisaeta souniana]|uniref:DNA-directed RNA polymerase subunit beta n=1 Tax=Vulcanisaeta souniana JCM 11219 TaxID=1293586 RepID=A0A830E4N4_9CREN|nr:DNA-directed RNA polymerase subunit B [Vulcanisaeta souniana]BDR91746.1 DNA-directed RNA polymerase subunit B [Vulcanisaeta souniana JCM 11219]GGI70706.1 DNA-directed RNA polymerase subunit B [Vulcanisaeta souniana JCM 11219]
MGVDNPNTERNRALDSAPIPVLRSRRLRGVFPSTDERWALVDAFIREGGLVKHQLDSFNDFVEKKLQEIVSENSIIETEVKGLYIKLERIEVGRPRVREADASEHVLYPMEARLRNLTYAAPLYLTMSLYVNDEEVDRQKVYIGDLPIMVRSKYCNLHGLKRQELISKLEDPDDPGGYFIINGSERVIVSQEDLAPDKPFYDKGDKASITHVAKVISIGAGYKTTVTVERHKDGIIYVIFPAIATRIPFPIVMRALGLETDEDIVLAVSDDPDIQNELLPSLQFSMQLANTVDDALDFIGSKVAIGQPRDVRIERARQVLDRYFLPHLGTTEEVRVKKALMIGQMVKGVIEMYLGRRQPDDKDHVGNKRVRLVGDLIAQLFRTVFRQVMQDVRQQLERHYSRGKIPSLVTLVRADIITERIRHALATGNWIGGRTGVSQMLDRTNILSTLSHLRRVVSNLSRTQPHFEARDLHPTQWGRLCAIETPEGQNCGLVKNLALLSTITVGVNEEEVEKMLYDLGVVPILKARKEGTKGSEVYLNGRLIGIHGEPDKLVSIIREMRRRGQISHEINIARIRSEHLDEVRVNCDGGRLRRPLLIIDNGKLRLKPEHIEKLVKGEWSWSDLISNGIIEFLDGEEEENALVAINPEEDMSKYTHMEIVPSVMLGAVASIIPYAEHNQSPRNIYEAAMAKQSLGFPAANYRFRMDSRGHLLIYPERPLVITRGMELNGYLRRPTGQNAIVALLTYTGYNMEDAVILNKSSIERGMFRSVFFRTYETEQMRYPGGEEDRIEIPSAEVRGYKGPEAYAHLDEDGIVSPEVFVSGGEVLIGKTSPPRFYGVYAETVVSSARRDSSITVRRGEKGIVDSVVITETNEGYKLVKVKVRELRIPELGDKFASRHGQKGVMGMMIPMQDMPFTEDGITPDVIVNPHALPSRMTVGQLLESMAGKVAALRGLMIDATPFEGVTEEELRDLLIRSGFRWDGKEIMYSGLMGRKLEADIFIGVVYYQKLHHMVADKIHARARGPVQILTRQPTEGRSREGGLRLGEMERDVLIAHGAAALLRERLVESSDRYVMYICEECGMIAWYDSNRGKPVCPIHGDKGRIARVVVPYAFKLMLQELMSLGIYPKIELGDLIEERRV